MSLRSLILVADDDDLLQAVLEHKLTAVGYDVALADHGRAVLERVGLLRPALIILDAMMPIMDGFEVLRRLQADAELRTIPVIMLTALRREADILTALNLGAVDYLQKPFSPDELIARLARYAPLMRKQA